MTVQDRFIQWEKENDTHIYLATPSMDVRRQILQVLHQFDFSDADDPEAARLNWFFTCDKMACFFPADYWWCRVIPGDHAGKWLDKATGKVRFENNEKLKEYSIREFLRLLKELQAGLGT